MGEAIQCIACGLEGYDIGPRVGRRRINGDRGVSQFCRWCARKPEIRERFRQAARRNSARLSMRRRRLSQRLAERSIVEYTSILGPAPCSRCRVPLYWTGLEWQDNGGHRHTCRRAMAA